MSDTIVAEYGMMWAMETSLITVYGISNCDTVKKARAWLSAQGLSYQFHDFKKQGVSAQLLDAWIEHLGWETLVNRRGNMWRRLDDTTRSGVTDAGSARALMLAQPSVIKRPVVEWADGRLSIGFAEALWRSRIG
jgi:Spx/MgsR family transcriptional regulator